MHIRRIFFTSLCLFIACRYGFAHKANLFCFVEDTTLCGEGYFSGGKPVRNGAITIYDAQSNEHIATTTTDDEGKFSYTLPTLPTSASLRIVLDAGQGHQATFRIEYKGRETYQECSTAGGEERPLSAPAGASEKKVRFLEERIRALEKQRSQAQFGSLIGGIGWIVALFALLFIIKKKNAS